MERDEAKKRERFRLATARIGERPWIPLDNASKIFLSTRSAVDTKVFRLTAGLADAVDPLLLQQALDLAFDEFPLFHGIIRRGIFWYFIERSSLRPKVQEEADIPCAQLFSPSYRGLLFRVLYRANRIHLEVFHALSDGNGAVSFFQLLLIHYMRLTRTAGGLEPQAVLPHYIATDSSKDSFTEYFRAQPNPEAKQKAPLLAKSRVYRVKGKKTLDGRMNILELHLRTSKVLAKAREAGGTLTTYLCAVFMQALYDTMPARQKERPKWRIVLSVPIDLRQFYPSLTSRNFFSTVMLSHEFVKDSPQTLAEITDALSAQLKEKATKEQIAPRVQRLVRLEELLVVRLTPLYLKDLILKLANHVNNLGITASMTNVGRFRLPGEVADDLQEAVILTSAVRPQFSVQSYDNDLAITFTSPKLDTAIQDRYSEILEAEGLNVNFAVESVLEDTETQVHKPTIVTASAGEVTEEQPDRTSAEHPPYPFIPVKTNLPLAQSILTAATIFSLLIYAAGNLWLGWQLPLPVLLVAVATLWITVIGILGNLHNPAWAILRQTIVFSLSVIALDLLNAWEGWSITWVLPIILGSSVIATQITLLASRKALERGVFFMQANAILALTPLVFILLGWVSPLWPSLLAMGIGGVSFLITAIWRRRVFGEEVRRKLHF